MRVNETRFALCVKNRGADDLELRKVYRVVRDGDDQKRGYLRVIDDSGEDYLYPASYFVLIELPERARRAWTARRTAKRASRGAMVARTR